MSVSPIPGYLTSAQVVERTGWAQATVSHYIKEGRLRGVKVASVWLIEAKSLDEYLATNPKSGPKPASK